MVIKGITEYDPKILNVLLKLLPELSSNAATPAEEYARRIVESDAARLLVAKETGYVVGILTIVIFLIPSGVRTWIEDVVVDETGRGKGVVEALSNYALKLAQSEGARTVDLTSRPSRESANRLYQRIVFTPRDTNVYRYTAEP